jgi:2-polyprenyl-3-methyl-5-hydroxy-6-metoxy-1,4-benzoquinol methylase
MKFLEKDIRPKIFSKIAKLCVEKDIKLLLESKKNFVNVSCPACLSKNNRFYFKKKGFHYSVCNNCFTYFINPRPTVKILDHFYKNSHNYKLWNKFIFPSSENIRKNKIFKPRVDICIKFLKKYNFKKPSILEVGAGFGTFSSLLNKSKYFLKVMAVEPSIDGYLNCKKKNINVINNVIENIQFKKKDRFNIVASFEVIEHLFSPKNFLVNIRKNLTDNGLIIFTCPNGDGFDVRFLEKNSHIIDHEHLNYFNTNSIKILLKKSGYETLEVLTPGKLDVDIVKNYIKENNMIIKDYFYKKIFQIDNQLLRDNFQDFISKNNLSSNMFVIARKI